MPEPLQRIYLNGVNGTTGETILLSPDEAVRIAARSLENEPHQLELQRRAERDSAGEVGVRRGIDVRDLSQAGWGVIFADDAELKVIDALRPLLTHRRNQAGTKYYEYMQDRGHRRGESMRDFLHRYRVSPSNAVDPKKMPYYLMIVGDPQRIPFRFQYELDVVYAVGRLHFQSHEDYHSYAKSVIESETEEPVAPKRAVFFGPSSPGDVATKMSSQYLAKPLAIELDTSFRDLQVEAVIGNAATKDYLIVLLHEEPPDLLFTASHGMHFHKSDPRLFGGQGALLCSDWPNPESKSCISEELYFSADDLADEAQMNGMISFHFACYSAGTPAWDDFPEVTALGFPDEQIAPHAFVAALPQKFLSRPKGGALAVVGHIERAWACSFVLRDGTPEIGVFEDALHQLVEGYPIGAAMEWFNQKHAALATQVAASLRKVQHGISLAHDELLNTLTLWTEQNDARNYVIIGDPAVRLQAAAGSL